MEFRRPCIDKTAVWTYSGSRLWAHLGFWLWTHFSWLWTYFCWLCTHFGSSLWTHFGSWKGLGYTSTQDPNEEILSRMENIKSGIAKEHADRDKATLAQLKLQKQAQDVCERELTQLRGKVVPLEMLVSNLESRMARQLEQIKPLASSVRGNEAKVKELQTKLNEVFIKSFKVCNELKCENDDKLKVVEQKLKANFDAYVCEERKICSEEFGESFLLLKKKSDEFSGIKKKCESQLLELEKQNTDLANFNRELDKKMQSAKSENDDKLKLVEKKLKATFDAYVFEERKICKEEVARSNLWLKKKSDELSGIMKTCERQLLKLEKLNTDLANSNGELDKKMQRQYTVCDAIMDKGADEWLRDNQLKMKHLKAENQELKDKISRFLDERNPFPRQKGSFLPSRIPVSIGHVKEGRFKNPETGSSGAKRKMVAYASNIPERSHVSIEEGHQRLKRAISSYQMPRDHKIQ